MDKFVLRIMSKDLTRLIPFETSSDIYDVIRDTLYKEKAFIFLFVNNRSVLFWFTPNFLVDENADDLLNTIIKSIDVSIECENKRTRG
jgi:hypothetical protein